MTAVLPAERAAEPDPPSPDILREAVRWFVLLASGEASDADRRRWLAWREADARHDAAWRRAEAVVAPFGAVSNAQSGVAAEALEQSRRRRAGRRRALRGTLGAFVGAVAGWQGWLAWRRSDWSAAAVTAVGQMRELTLADGSRLQLDTDTAIDVVMSDTERLIRLRRGRLMIATGKGVGAQSLPPLWVQTSDGRVQALGTRFTVQQGVGATRVAVLEHRVALYPGGASPDRPPALVLGAGQAARFDARGLVEPQPSGPADSAWTRGMLVADDMTLGEWVAEIARYRHEPLICDPDARGLRISGTYPLTDSRLALAALARTLPVRIVPRQPGNAAAGLVVARER